MRWRLAVKGIVAQFSAGAPAMIAVLSGLLHSNHTDGGPPLGRRAALIAPGAFIAIWKLYRLFICRHVICYLNSIIICIFRVLHVADGPKGTAAQFSAGPPLQLLCNCRRAFPGNHRCVHACSFHWFWRSISPSGVSAHSSVAPYGTCTTAAFQGV